MIGPGKLGPGLFKGNSTTFRLRFFELDRFYMHPGDSLSDKSESFGCSPTEVDDPLL